MTLFSSVRKKILYALVPVFLLGGVLIYSAQAHEPSPPTMLEQAVQEEVRKFIKRNPALIRHVAGQEHPSRHAQGHAQGRGLDKNEVERVVGNFLKKNPDFLMRVMEDELKDFLRNNPDLLPEGGGQEQARDRGRDRDQQQGRPARDPQQQKNLANLAEVREDDHVYGNPDAPFTLIEYADIECPFCQRMHDTARQLVDQSNGEVNWVYRHLPLESIHPGAMPKAIAVECASALGGEKAFWALLDAFFADEVGLDGASAFVADHGIDSGKFENCVDNRKYEDEIRAGVDEAQSAGITGTPGNVFVNNKTGEHKFLSGAVPLGRLKQGIQNLK